MSNVISTKWESKIDTYVNNVLIPKGAEVEIVALLISVEQTLITFKLGVHRFTLTDIDFGTKFKEIKAKKKYTRKPKEKQLEPLESAA